MTTVAKETPKVMPKQPVPKTKETAQVVDTSELAEVLRESQLVNLVAAFIISGLPRETALAHAKALVRDIRAEVN